MKRAIELIRVSTKEQAASDRASIPAQRAINQRTAKAYGLQIVRSIEISDVSGAAILYAPEMRELLELIKDPEIFGVVAREFSRLMRPENYGDFAILQAFAETNTRLYLPDGEIDFASKTGRLLGTLRASIAGMERQEILERIWGAKEEKRRAGKFAQSKMCLPYGVDYEESRGWFYKPDAEKVREAFQLFLAGENSFANLERRVGISRYSLRIILRNPIYTGWRVIEEKRDMRVRKVKKDGRQADRPKVKRAPDEIIRVKVIEEGIVSEGDFARVQQMMDIKKTRHWRTREDYKPRYIYNGLLSCSVCGDLVQTHSAGHDYYGCKRRLYGKQCDTPYMRRDRLDALLDELFADRLSDKGFLREIAQEFNRNIERKSSVTSQANFEAQIVSLQSKRQRILDTYFEGLITNEERNARITKIEQDVKLLQDKLFHSPSALTLDAKSLSEIFSVFQEYKFLNRADKRRILSTITPDIRVANYELTGLYLMLADGGEMSLVGTDSWPKRA